MRLGCHQPGGLEEDETVSTVSFAAGLCATAGPGVPWLRFQAYRDDYLIGRQMPDVPKREGMIEQFNRLMEELLSGSLQRSSFQGWEMEILLDIENRTLSKSSWHKLLRRYQRAVQRHMEKGARLPLRFSEYLASLEERRIQRRPAAAERSADLRFNSGTR